jgi:peptidyl-tRNA hydrolase, PTH1 family
VAEESLPWLVIGLGNPGREYAGNRHNLGYLVADLLAGRIGARFGRHRRAVAVVAEGRLRSGVPGTPEFLAGRRLVITKPLTYMNLAGGPTAGLMRFYKVPASQLIAVHDDLDLPYGQVRAKFGGGEGGHNGLRSVSRSLGTRDYLRVRVGIGRPPGRQDPADFVLTDFSSVERKELDFIVDRAADVTEAIVTRGLEWAQNAYHGG